MLRSNCLAIILLLAGYLSHSQNNVIKASFTGPLAGDVNFGFEKAVNRNSSINIRLGYLDPLLSPFISEDMFTPRAYTLQEARGGISAALEYRFYLSEKNSIQGFYIAPYARYFNQDMVFSDEIENKIFTVKTNINTLGVGGQFGYQWIFNKVFTLDLYFIGAGVDYHNGNIKYTLEPQPPGFDYSMVTPHVDDVFVDIKYLHKRLKHVINEDNHTTKLPFLFPSLRMGGSIGIAF